MEPNTKGWIRVRDIFGNDILNEDKTLNREKLGKIVFEDETKRKLLNRALHNLIRIEMIKQIFIYFLKGYKFIILDVPLLFEAKSMLKLISFKIVVDCDEETQLKRVLARNPELSKQDAILRMRSQMKREDRLKLGDFIIDNSNDLESTRKQIETIYQTLNQSNKHLYGRFVLGGILFISIYYLKKFLF